MAGPLAFVVRASIMCVITLITFYFIQIGFQFNTAHFFYGPGSWVRIGLLALILSNFKNVPLVWHARLFGGLFQHYFPSSDRGPLSPKSLFQPLVTTTHSPLMECDFNMHKSNATFFSDLDIGRTQLMAHLLGPGVAKLRNNAKTKIVRQAADGKPAKGAVNICLGATQCTFKREIKPYEQYEMWSRILTWDEKWVYVLTHFVAKGAVKIPVFPGETSGKKDEVKEMDSRVRKAIFASAVTKQVVKIGRLSVDPKVVLTASGLLGEDVDAEIEEKKQRGLVFANHFLAMDGLVDEFQGAENGILSVSGDLF